MRLTYDDDQRLLERTSTKLFAEQSPLDRARGGGLSWPFWRQLAELGWVGTFVPEAYGGYGLGFVHQCIVLEAAGRRLAPDPFLASLLGAQALLTAGTEAHKRRWLPAIVSGESFVSLASDERGSRYDLDRVETTADRTKSGWSITGEKIGVLDGAEAAASVVSARTAEGLSLFLVGHEASGLGIERQTRIDGRGAALMHLRGCEVDEAALLGEAGQGAAALEVVLDVACVGIAAEMLGAASQAFDDTLAYLKTREQFGRPIGAFQALQHRAARLFMALTMTRSAVLGAAAAIDTGADDVRRLASLAKAHASEVFLDVANEAIQMHGGIGMTDEHSIGLYLKRARAAGATFGDAAWHRDRWARIAGY